MELTSTDGTRIVTTEAGEGPPVLLVPGSAHDATAMGGLVRELAPSFTCHAMDRRGTGKSGDSPEYAIEREFEDVAVAVAALSEPLIVFGHSFGTLCALDAARRGARIETLVLYDPPIPLDGPPAPEIIDAAEAALAAGDHRGVLEVLLRQIVRLPDSEWAVVSTLPDRWFEAFAHTALREMAAVTDGDIGAYADIEANTLLLLGTESPPHVARATRELAAVMPRATLELLEGQGHNAILAAPQLIADRITSFLGR